MGDQILQTTEQPSAAEKAPEAWMHTDSRGEKQAFTSEPPPGLKAKCQALYPGQPQQEPLADEQWLKRWTGRTGRRLKPGPERDRLLRIFRFAEHAHGIGGKA
ncbi:MAG: hypothetical protein A2486_03135 [Burkholderiales bacterium RIFOXYC12_FULL_65_23]|nr:MAG: hypothetical protein A2486_03135 [Burkholderiales bacterium RIFOXYC12_FULL_65_23]